VAVSAPVVICLPPPDERVRKPPERGDRYSFGWCLPQDGQESSVCLRPKPRSRVHSLIGIIHNDVVSKELTAHAGSSFRLDFVKLSSLFVRTTALRVSRLLHQRHFRYECVDAAQNQISINRPQVSANS
jgi:hypothetical protein